jgi:hypothetical protein
MPSLRATGSFTPDSRIALADKADPAFPDQWEQMARASFRRYNELLGLPGDPVRWIDRYVVSDPGPPPPRQPVAGELAFANYSAASATCSRAAKPCRRGPRRSPASTSAASPT